MLTKRQRRSVVRALIVAYYEYRDLPYLQVCRRFGICLIKNDYDSGGSAEANWAEKDVAHNIEIPGRAPKAEKEHVFWHEFCHLVLERCCVFEPRLIGYQGAQQMHNFGTDYWDQERLCEAFADAVFLHRYCLLEQPSDMEAFLFADIKSIGYAETLRFSLRRIEAYVSQAETLRRNINLSALKKMLKLKEQVIDNCAHQQRLPTHFYEHHQCPGPRFVDEEADIERQCQLSEGKESWRWTHPREQRLTNWAYRLIEANKQLALFEEVARADKKKFEKAVARFDQAVKKFQRT